MSRNINEGQRPKISFGSRKLAALSTALALTAACTPSINKESCIISGSPQRGNYSITVELPSSVTQTVAMWGTKPLPEEVRDPRRKEPHRLNVRVGENDPYPAIEIGGLDTSKGSVEVDIPVGTLECSIGAISISDKPIRVRPTPTAIPTPTRLPGPSSRDTATRIPAPRGF